MKNIIKQSFKLTQSERSIIKKHRPLCIWFEGLSGSGKSTLINLLDIYLNNKGMHTYALDGDNLRFGLNSDLGFNNEDRNENIRRASEVASLMVDAGLIVLAGFITPLESQRESIRSKFKNGQFIEIFLSTPLSVCEDRDVKGLYKKARQNEITDFTGISSPFELSKNAEIVIDTSSYHPHESLQEIINFLKL